MAFSYHDDLATDRDKVRFWLQDTAEKKGPKPGNDNFTDAELDALIALEENWQQAVAAGFEVLASGWTKETSFSVFNGSFQRSEAAKVYKDLAEYWRKTYGEGGNITDELGGKTTDFSGDTVTPLFQREAFGHKVTDWDPA